jgi:23S rRNA pseudouridine2605 synthase
MRINAYVARASGLSRRAADQAIENRHVLVNGRRASLGQNVKSGDTVTLDGKILELESTTTTIILNKPTGYVCSRSGQGNRTIYDLLPARHHNLNPAGRLDKDSSGLLLLTDDGALANRLTHPRYNKTKVYEVELDRPLNPSDKDRIGRGVQLDDGISKLQITDLSDKRLKVRLSEGRNRQIRRTFAALGYRVARLHRTQFGDYRLNGLPLGKYESRL